jgi:hypothetical protein
MNFQNVYTKVIMSTFNHHLPLLGKCSDPLKILQNGGKAGKNTPSQNLGLAGLHLLQNFCFKAQQQQMHYSGWIHKEWQRYQ